MKLFVTLVLVLSLYVCVNSQVHTGDLQRHSLNSQASPIGSAVSGTVNLQLPWDFLQRLMSPPAELQQQLGQHQKQSHGQAPPFENHGVSPSDQVPQGQTRPAVESPQTGEPVQQPQQRPPEQGQQQQRHYYTKHQRNLAQLQPHQEKHPQQHYTSQRQRVNQHQPQQKQQQHYPSHQENVAQRQPQQIQQVQQPTYYPQQQLTLSRQHQQYLYRKQPQPQFHPRQQQKQLSSVAGDVKYYQSYQVPRTFPLSHAVSWVSAAQGYPALGVYRPAQGPPRRVRQTVAVRASAPATHTTRQTGGSQTAVSGQVPTLLQPPSSTASTKCGPVARPGECCAFPKSCLESSQIEDETGTCLFLGQDTLCCAVNTCK